MKRIRPVFLALILIGTVSVLRADDISDNFGSHLTQASLNALTKDLGALMGGGSFHHGKSLGFPLGFDIGVHVPIVGLQDDDFILRDNGSTSEAFWGQIELGLPAKIGLIGRFGKILDGDTIGGGLRYGLYKSAVPFLPSVSISALYDKMKHPNFNLITYTGNAVLSFELPFIDPYVGGGYDSSKMTSASGTTLEGKADGTRVEAGVNIHLIPFTYINLAGGLANGEKMYHGGAGVRF
jgi:hypothetical protein